MIECEIGEFAHLQRVQCGVIYGAVGGVLFGGAVIIGDGEEIGPNEGVLATGRGHQNGIFRAAGRAASAVGTRITDAAQAAATRVTVVVVWRHPAFVEAGFLRFAGGLDGDDFFGDGLHERQSDQ